MVDIVIENCQIADGTGSARYPGDIAICRDTIVAVGQVDESVKRECRTRLDIHGKVACPGFIDMHSHSDLAVISSPTNTPKISQGITTEVIGNCGISFAPVSTQGLDDLHKLYSSVAGSLDPLHSWQSVAEYLDVVERKTSTNLVFLVGHAALRYAAMGMSACAASPEQVSAMVGMTREAMEQGAWGVSTGLTYVPGCFSSTDELTQIGCAVAKAGGLYCTHMRAYGAQSMTAINEAAGIGQAGSMPVHLSHLQTVGSEGKGQSHMILDKIAELRSAGVDITFDSYPYTAGSSTLHWLLPLWVQTDGPEAMLRRIGSEAARSRLRSELPAEWAMWGSTIIRTVVCPADEGALGRTVSDIAQAEGKHPVDVVCDLCASNKLMVSQVNFLGNDEDVEVFMGSEWQMFGTDGLHASGNPHPRLWGAYPRVLCSYVRERHVLSLEEAIRKMTGSPAGRLGLRHRGLVREGYAADLVVFDPNTIRDRATYDRGDLPADGIEYVIVNGQIVVSTGKPTGALPGRVLRRRAR